MEIIKEILRTYIVRGLVFKKEIYVSDRGAYIWGAYLLMGGNIWDLTVFARNLFFNARSQT